MLRLKCREEGFYFINNDNIYMNDLVDGLHLNHVGNLKFMRNLLKCCPSYNPYLYDCEDCHRDSFKGKCKNVVIQTEDEVEEDGVIKIEDGVIEDGDTLNEEFNTILRNIRTKNINRIIIATLNINSLPNKFEQLKISILGNIDILVITETKLDNSFPTTQFIIDGFSIPYRKDRNIHGGGILIYVREDIPSKELKKHTFPDDIEGMFVEINLRKAKWLLFGSYHPPNQCDNYYFDKVSNSLDIYIDRYDKFLLAGDFNSEDSEPVGGLHQIYSLSVCNMVLKFYQYICRFTLVCFIIYVCHAL